MKKKWKKWKKIKILKNFFSKKNGEKMKKKQRNKQRMKKSDEKKIGKKNGKKWRFGWIKSGCLMNGELGMERFSDTHQLEPRKRRQCRPRLRRIRNRAFQCHSESPPECAGLCDRSSFVPVRYRLQRWRRCGSSVLKSILFFRKKRKISEQIFHVGFLFCLSPSFPTARPPVREQTMPIIFTTNVCQYEEKEPIEKSGNKFWSEKMKFNGQNTGGGDSP